MNFGSTITNAGSFVSFTDSDGNEYAVRSGNPNPWVNLEPHKEEIASNEYYLSLKVTNISDKPLFIQDIAPLEISRQFKGYLELGSPMSLWTTLISEISGGVEDLCMAWHDDSRDLFVSPDYMMIGSKRTDNYMFAGFLVDEACEAELDLKASGSFSFERFSARSLFEGIELQPGESISGDTLFLSFGNDPRPILKRYADLLAEPSVSTQVSRKMVGWSPWDYYLGGVTEQDLVDNVNWLAARREEIPVEFIQLDHGFQKCEGDWLTTNEKFPSGLKWLSDFIYTKGFTPALWLCPFLVAEQSSLYAEHPDWVIKAADGSPLKLNGYAVKAVYGLDCSIPEAREWVKELGRRTVHEFGYQYIKLDGANGQILSTLGVLKDPKVTKGAACRMGLQAFKEGMGKDAFLLNAFQFRLSSGIADGMRIGEDVGGRWDGSRIAKHYGERDNFPGPGEVLRGISSTGAHYWMHRRLWVNDSDYMVVRQKGSRSDLSLPEARTWASCVSLTDGLMILGDNLMELTDDRVDIIKKVMPAFDGSAIPVDFFQKRTASIYDLKVKTESEDWTTLLVMNTDKPERTRDYEINLEAIGLDPTAEYLVFEFWRSKYWGLCKEKISVSALEARDSCVLSIRKRTGIPQVLGTDIHISQGGVEIESAKFDTGTNTMTVKTKSCGKEGSVYIYTPEGYKTEGQFQTGNAEISRLRLKADGSSYT
ncbi:MAG: alpha-galactosidase, partial [Lentisphaerae bacterium]|nr:alpha-galactosidase [Lentisphaerota bacterium]